MSAFLISLLLTCAAPSDEQAALDAAESAFAEGARQRENGDRGAAAFRKAARAYEDLRNGGAENADLYLNLGNARLLAGDLPRAILAYRRGLRLAPSNARLRDGLTHARAQVVYAERSALGRPVEPLRPAWLPALRPGWLSLLTAVAYAAACACLTRWWMLRQGWALAGAILLLGVATAGVALLVAEWWSGPPRPLVVLARDGVLLRKGNGSAFPPWVETPLNRGVEAEVVFERGGWLQVELMGGEVGWVSATEVVRE